MLSLVITFQDDTKLSFSEGDNLIALAFSIYTKYFRDAGRTILIDDIKSIEITMR